MGSIPRVTSGIPAGTGGREGSQRFRVLDRSGMRGVYSAPLEGGHMGFSVLSWNVEHFGGGETPVRQNRVVKHIKDQDPDIFGILEVENADIRKLMETSFPDHDFFLTDGPQLQEILIGCRRGVFDQKLFVQKREYQEGNDALRPGALLSVRQGAVWTNILFLHVDSGVDAGAFGNRFDNFRKVWNLSRALARKSANEETRECSATSVQS